MKIDLRSYVPEEVEVTVEPKTVDAIAHIVGIGIGKGCANLKVAEPAGGWVDCARAIELQATVNERAKIRFFNEKSPSPLESAASSAAG